MPFAIVQEDHDWIAVASASGRLLVFPSVTLPTLSKGKGNKMLQIATKALATRQDYVIAMTVLGKKSKLQLQLRDGTVHTVTAKEWQAYRGERGERGTKLPKDQADIVGLSCTGRS